MPESGDGPNLIASPVPGCAEPPFSSTPSYPVGGLSCLTMSEGLRVLRLLMLCVVLQRFAPASASVGHQRSKRVVQTKYGPLQGFYHAPPNKNLPQVEVFLGVPYASPPVRSLRFMPPVTPPHWSDVQLCDQFKPVCPQKFPDISNETETLRHMPRARYDYLKRFQPFLSNYSEDCLYLNIYVPNKASSENLRLPVMVYIHGESYEWNSGNTYDGSVLASFGEVLVVTVNYRLGILGFLNAGAHPTRGNYGLLDQVAALHWIEENIKEFGGDPSNVTIFGHDHGAACVNFLMISRVAKGLFHRSILMSGSALAHWALVEEPTKYAKQLATALECKSIEDEEIPKCLRSTPLESLLGVELDVPEHLTAFGPSVDGVIIPTDPEVVMEGLHEMRDRYDLMFGVTSTEGVFHFSNDEFMQGFGPDKKSRVLRTFVRNIYKYHMNEIYSVLNNEYTDWTKPVQHPINIRDSTIEMIGDAQFVAPLVRAGDLHSLSYFNTYFYVFEHQVNHEDYPTRLGCFHGEELPYVFGAPLVDGLSHFRSNYTRAERTISEAVMRYWTNFAKTGDPNDSDRQGDTDESKNKNRFRKVAWPQYETVHQKYLSIDIRPKIRHHFRAHKMSVWLKLIPDIHHSGGSSVSMQHHLLDNHDDPSTFEGVLRPLSSYEQLGPSSTLAPNGIFSILPGSNNTGRLEVNATPVAPPVVNGQMPTPSGAPPSPATTDSEVAKNATNSLRVQAIQQGTYSTALSVTIAVGCSLLILNVLIFAGVYYQRDKNRVQAKVNDRSSAHLQNKKDTDEGQLAGLGLHTIRAISETPQKIPPPRTPPPSPISKARQLPDYPDPVNSTTGAATLNIPRPVIKTGPDNLALPESQPLLLQNLQLRPPVRKPNMQEVRV